MRRFHSFICALLLWECLLAPHHWATNYMVGFCDTWGMYLKGMCNLAEPMLPIVSFFEQIHEGTCGSQLFKTQICPNRAQRHVIHFLYALPPAKEVSSCRFFDKASFRVRLSRDEKVFYLSQWESLKRYVHIVDAKGYYADHPFGENNGYAEIYLDSFDPSFYPWPYYDPITVEVEFCGLDMNKYNEVNAKVCIRLYNLLDL